VKACWQSFDPFEKRFRLTSCLVDTETEDTRNFEEQEDYSQLMLCANSCGVSG
jgi:hypothetical protein